ncbi:hypothetical protein V8E55_006934 [Tylopilus felleus]
MPSTSGSKRATSPTSHDSRPLKRGKTASKSRSKKGKKCVRRDHASDEDGSDSEVSGASESDPESDTEHGIPLKDLRGVGRTIARCWNMFCNINKAIHLVMLSKQEEQAAKGESDSDED